MEITLLDVHIERRQLTGVTLTDRKFKVTADAILRRTMIGSVILVQ